MSTLFPGWHVPIQCLCGPGFCIVVDSIRPTHCTVTLYYSVILHCTLTLHCTVTYIVVWPYIVLWPTLYYDPTLYCDLHCTVTYIVLWPYIVHWPYIALVYWPYIVFWPYTALWLLLHHGVPTHLKPLLYFLICYLVVVFAIPTHSHHWESMSWRCLVIFLVVYFDHLQDNVYLWAFINSHFKAAYAPSRFSAGFLHRDNQCIVICIANH